MIYDNSERDLICNSLSINEIVSKYAGIEGDRHNRCACPLHGGENHNFTLYPKTNSFYCFTCGAGGDVIKFVSLYLGISYSEAIKQIDNDYGFGFYERKQTTYNSYAKRLLKRKQEQQNIQKLKEYSKCAYNKLLNYHKWLLKQPKTKEIEFDIHFIERKLDYHLRLDEKPINYDVTALIKALYSKHRKGVNNGE